MSGRATVPFRRAATASALAALVAIAFAAAAPVATAKQKVKAPKSGKYEGTTGAGRDLTIYVSGKAVQLIAFGFPCKNTSGNTSLSDIKLKKTRKGYRFSTTAHGIVSYSDERPDENGTIKIAGRFSRKTAKTVKGSLSVKTPRCGSTGAFKWHASR